MAALPMEQAITRFKNNEDRVDGYVNGPGYTTTDGVFVKGLRDQFAPFNIYKDRGDWVAGTAYKFRDIYNFGGISYLVTQDHVSTTVAADGSAGKVIQWQGATTLDVNNAVVSGETSDQLAEYAARLYAGTAVKAGFYGDSTAWGYNGYDLSTFVPVPTPLAFQNTINALNGNTAFTVVNHGIGGTTAVEMIAGTDTSGSTFESKMRTSDEQIVLCNHGINDNTKHTPQQFRAAIIEFVRIVRKYNKSPVLVTPFACFFPSALGTARHTMRGHLFAQVIRSVCTEYGVPLVDNFKFSDMMLKSGDYNREALLPDGIHGSPYFYEQMGRNCALALFNTTPLTFAENMFSPGVGVAAATAQSALRNEISKSGMLFMSNAGNTTMKPSIRMLVNVGESGGSLVLARIMWPGAVANGKVTVDGPANAQVTKCGYVNGTFVSGSYPTDCESLIADKVCAGVHLVVFDGDATGALANQVATTCNYVKLIEPETKPNSHDGANGTVAEIVTASMPHAHVTNGRTVILGGLRTDRTKGGFTVSFRATLNDQTGVAVCTSRLGDTSTTAGGFAVCRSILLYRNGSQLTVCEQVSNADFQPTQIGAYPGTEATYAIEVSQDTGGASGHGTVRVFVNGTLVGTRVLEMPYNGGAVALWSNGIGALTVYDLQVSKMLTSNSPPRQ